MKEHTTNIDYYQSMTFNGYYFTSICCVIYYVILIMIHLLQIRLVCKGEETNRVTNNIETPPTTPDSFKNTLTTSAANTVDNSKSTVTLDDTKVFAGSNVKNEAAPRHPSNSANVSNICCLEFLLILIHLRVFLLQLYKFNFYDKLYRMKV